MSDYLKACNNN